MMSQISKAAIVIVIALLTIISCSRGDKNQAPVTPDLNSEELVQTNTGAGVDNSGHRLWGYYLFYVNPAHNKVTMVPLREAANHWNVLKFLEKGPCYDCVKVTGITPTDHNTTEFDVEIRHPFASKNLTGFDVRGIAMFRGNLVFPQAGLIMPDRDAGDGELYNPDGYTSLYNLTTAGSGPGGLQGYLKGKFASLTAPNATLNGYKRYIYPGAANTRNAFYAGATLVSTFDLVMPGTYFIFGYAIDASWAPPTVNPVVDPMTDFPPEANCPEPWKINVVVEPVPGLTDQGGEVTLKIDVYDRQGSDSHQAPTVECPALFDGIKVADFIDESADYSHWEVKIGNEKKVGSGIHRFLVKVVDDEALTAPAWLDLTAYQVGIVIVSPTGWSRTWGGIKADKASVVSTDDKGNVYVAGSFQDTVDFDPGPGTDNHTAFSQDDAFLCKYDSSGTFKWARTWGGDNPESVGSICIDTSENIYLTGVFGGTIDFDPGPGEDLHTGVGFMDAYLTRYDSDGNYIWTVTWGGSAVEIGTGVAVSPQGDVYVTGEFTETVDFDPGTGEWSGSSNGDNDIYLSKFGSGGDFIWANIWGGPGEDYPGGVSVDPDGRPYVAGKFRDTVDFDPNSGTENRTSNGSGDCFLICFMVGGNFKWVDTWGGTGDEWASEIEYDPKHEVFYVAGNFMNDVDFDPGPGVDNHISVGQLDSFLSCLDSSGAFLWARTWGGTANEYTFDVEVDQSTGPAVSGFFNSPVVDFDPGAGNDDHTGNGGFDACLSMFDSDGNYIWARTWGGIDYDAAPGIAMSHESPCIYIVGEFKGTVDMDPSPANDDHVSNGESDAFLSKFLPDGSW